MEKEERRKNMLKRGKSNGRKNKRKNMEGKKNEKKKYGREWKNKEQMRHASFLKS